MNARLELHPPSVPSRPAGFADVRRCLGLLLRRGAFGEGGRSFLAVLQVVAERLALTAALAHQAAGGFKHESVRFNVSSEGPESETSGDLRPVFMLSSAVLMSLVLSFFLCLASALFSVLPFWSHRWENQQSVCVH